MHSVQGLQEGCCFKQVLARNVLASSTLDLQELFAWDGSKWFKMVFTLFILLCKEGINLLGMGVQLLCANSNYQKNSSIE